MSNLKDKVVLITGASSGIGAGTAIHLAALGCRLSLSGRNTTNLNSVADQCCTAGLPKEKILCVAGDLCKPEDCEHVVNTTIEHFGQLDVLVNSAGILVSGGIESLSVEDYDRQMDVNVRSIFIVTKLAIPHIIKTKGNIVNVSSVTGLRAFPNVLAYNMSKAALDQMTRTIALELADRGVRVNSVNPGVVITQVHKRGGMTDEQYAKFLEHGKTTHAMGRVATVDEVAKAIAFLASDDASFVTGVTLPVDGGRSVMCPR